MSVPDFNIDIIMNSVKLTRDPPKKVKANSLAVLQSYSSTKV